VAVIFLVECLVAGHAHLGGVDHDNVVTSVDVGRVNGLVLAAQTAGNLGRQASQDQIIGVDHEPVVFDFMRFSGKGFHIQPLHRGVSRKAAHFNRPYEASQTVLNPFYLPACLPPVRPGIQSSNEWLAPYLHLRERLVAAAVAGAADTGGTSPVAQVSGAC